MKNYISTFLLLITLITRGIIGIDPVSGQSPGFNLALSTVNLNEGSVDDGSDAYTIRMEFCKFPVGDPDLPAVSALILIPNGTTLSVTYSPGEFVVKEGEIPPVPPILSDNFTGVFPSVDSYRDNDVYNSTALYPDSFYEIKRLGKIRGQEAAILFIYPYKYDPVNKKTYYYQDLELNIQYQGEVQGLPGNIHITTDPLKPGGGGGNDPLKPGGGGGHDPLESTAINYSQVIDLENAVSGGSAVNYNQGYYFIIITQDNLKPAADRLAMFKNATGLSTFVKSFPNPITETQVESYINDCYNTMDPMPQYFLLMGDVDIIPPSSQIPGVLTDLPYFDIDDGNPRLPDFSSGRIPVSTLDDANHWVDKTIRYERLHQYDPFFTKAGIITFFQSSTGNSGIELCRYVRTSEEIANYLEDQNIKSVDKLFYSEETSITNYTDNIAFMMPWDHARDRITDIELPGGSLPWNADNIDIRQSINNGKFLIIAREHGSETSWGVDATHIQFDESDVDSLSNGKYTPVVWSISCNTGKFNGATDCLAEKLAKKVGGGAVGVIAATNETETTYNDHLALYLTEEIWPGILANLNGQQDYIEGYGGLRMGDVLREGLLSISHLFSDNHLPINWEAQNTIESYHWLGDPTLEILPFRPCDTARVLNSITLNNGDICLYNHAENITVNGTSVINSGGDGDFRAGSSILFNTGFKVNPGGHFYAENEACYEPAHSTAPVTKSAGIPVKFSGLQKENPNSVIGNEFQIYPNPSKGIVYINCMTDEASMNFEIYSLQGACVYKGVLNDGFATVDLTTYSKGIYIIKIVSKMTVKDYSIIIN